MVLIQSEMGVLSMMAILIGLKILIRLYEGALDRPIVCADRIRGRKRKIIFRREL
jgi:hypothetical protein